jgi:hypothetical protein
MKGKRRLKDRSTYKEGKRNLTKETKRRVFFEKECLAVLEETDAKGIVVGARASRLS